MLTVHTPATLAIENIIKLATRQYRKAMAVCTELHVVSRDAVVAEKMSSCGFIARSASLTGLKVG